MGSWSSPASPATSPMGTRGSTIWNGSQRDTRVRRPASSSSEPLTSSSNGLPQGPRAPGPTASVARVRSWSSSSVTSPAAPQGDEAGEQAASSGSIPASRRPSAS
jgi:hypothetical protein